MAAHSKPIQQRSISDYNPDTPEEDVVEACAGDRQGYPLYPNRSTTYVLEVGSAVENFSKVGFSQTANHNKPDQPWKIIHYNCLGVLLCNRDGCSYTGPPPTGCRKIEEALLRSSGWGLLRHKGFHNHPWPTPKKPNPLAKKDLAAQIMKNPKASALQLKIGEVGDPETSQAPFEAVVAIHELLGNLDRLQYYRRDILRPICSNRTKKKGDVGDKFIHDMFQWDEHGMEMISNSFRRSQEHFTFQTNWMSERLLDQCKDGEKLYSGGLISDVTYRFFQTGYLLTTSMYCNTISRWIPVQLSWIRHLSEEYYTIHFTVLFRQFMTASILPHKRKKLATSIVDFSAAQQKGFVMAYMKVFGKNEDEALRKLKGCQEHF
ncbi:hypothetical protein PCASD_00218 [Puccinia coronata f. sp. avenae]|uniref:GCM domain-containing protein n=1 Tax=Puccinia coronata f. sp. avenae TaxID=200324 RepID=A0A2N5VQY2_9BASI|nr:hypothetical protein PCASD_00218 [Puccinia coronata f. sp. avenae]